MEAALRAPRRNQPTSSTTSARFNFLPPQNAQGTIRGCGGSDTIKLIWDAVKCGKLQQGGCICWTNLQKKKTRAKKAVCHHYVENVPKRIELKPGEGGGNVYFALWGFIRYFPLSPFSHQLRPCTWVDAHDARW